MDYFYLYNYILEKIPIHKSNDKVGKKTHPAPITCIYVFEYLQKMEIHKYIIYLLGFYIYKNKKNKRRKQTKK